MTAATTSDRVSLYYREGSSDKIYQASIEPSGEPPGTGFLVTFAYGRRGSTLQTGTKTPAPVAYAAAKKIYDKLISEKMAKGYTPGSDGTPYTGTDRAERHTGILPQLLNPIDEDQANGLIAADAWAMQEKLDGKRIMIRKSSREVVGINRSGLVVALPQPLARCAQALPGGDFVLDGESIGDTYYAFDLLELGGVDLRARPYRARLAMLDQLVAATSAGGPLKLVATVTGAMEKGHSLAELRERKAEGAVFKRLDARYTPGRPASGGPQVKLKFTATASCIVAAGRAGKRSVALELLDSGGVRVGVGNVTIPGNQTIPSAGSVVEVRYLYAFREGGLFQPVYLGVRDDVGVDACTVGQLKFKADAGGDEDADN